MVGGPGTLLRLAELDLREGKIDDARRHIDRGLARLATFPLGGMNVRLLEKRLRELLQRIGD